MSNERSSPSRTAGVVMRKVTLAGTEYTLSQPDRVRKAADEEAVVISRRLDMLPALARSCASLPEEERAAWRKDYIATMTCGIASPEEWAVYYRSLWQPAFRFWNALDPVHKMMPGDPGDRTSRPPRPPVAPRPMTLLEGVEWSYELLNSDDVSKEEIDSMWLAIRVVSQEEQLGNSFGSEEKAAILPTDIPTTAAGLPSMPGAESAV